MELINSLKWRYATKKFDNSKKVSRDDLNTIKEAIRLSASSYGLQAYKVLIIEDLDLREKLKSVSWGQSQITDASHLIVFCHHRTVSDDLIDGYMKLKADTQGKDVDNLKGYGDFIKEKLGERSATEVEQWTAKQTYIALGNLLSCCAELRIDSCPMEGFEPSKYDEILGLSAKGLAASVIATIGYRSSEDETQHATKVRKPSELLFEEI